MTSRIRNAVNTAAHQLGRAYGEVARQRLQSEADAALSTGAHPDVVLSLIGHLATELDASVKADHVAG